MTVVSIVSPHLMTPAAVVVVVRDPEPTSLSLTSWVSVVVVAVNK